MPRTRARWRGGGLMRWCVCWQAPAPSVQLSKASTWSGLSEGTAADLDKIDKVLSPSQLISAQRLDDLATSLALAG
jgi:hypothetical protein